ncbi:MAG: helix-turn-helix domain-containing protein [Afipia sp.]|nr:helix-turn-helix domain-containing protein [Afipia sp.]
MPDRQPVIDHDRYIPALLLFVANKLASGASNTYRRLFGVGVTEWRILSLLANEPDCSAQRISQFFDLDKALVSRTLQVMAKSQIIAIDFDPYRRRTINLTRAGATAAAADGIFRRRDRHAGRISGPSAGSGHDIECAGPETSTGCATTVRQNQGAQESRIPARQKAAI